VAMHAKHVKYTHHIKHNKFVGKAKPVAAKPVVTTGAAVKPAQDTTKPVAKSGAN
jgi:hypothetical protein